MLHVVVCFVLCICPIFWVVIDIPIFWVVIDILQHKL